MNSRPRRPPFVSGHYYHLYNRGAHRMPIFQEHDDYIFVIRQLKEYSIAFEISIMAYCLMPNHYHLLVCQESEQRAGLLPQRVFNSYSKMFNARYNHSGTLFEGPYKSVEVATEAHLRHLCRYIHANPVKDGIVHNVEDWPYSNYLEWIGLRHGSLVDRNFIEGVFGSADNYMEAVQDFLILKSLPVELGSYLR